VAAEERPKPESATDGRSPSRGRTWSGGFSNDAWLNWAEKEIPLSISDCAERLSIGNTGAHWSRI